MFDTSFGSNSLSKHRRPKLRIRGVIWFFFLHICERSAKRDMGHILLPNNRIGSRETRNVTRSRLTAYGGVVLQRLEGLNL